LVRRGLGIEAVGEIEAREPEAGIAARHARGLGRGEEQHALRLPDRAAAVLQPEPGIEDERLARPGRLRRLRRQVRQGELDLVADQQLLAPALQRHCLVDR